MSVEKIVGVERLQQIVSQNSLKNKNAEPKQVEQPNSPAVKVKLGSGLEKTALLNEIYK